MHSVRSTLHSRPRARARPPHTHTPFRGKTLPKREGKNPSTPSTAITMHHPHWPTSHTSPHVRTSPPLSTQPATHARACPTRRTRCSPAVTPLPFRFFLPRNGFFFPRNGVRPLQHLHCFRQRSRKTMESFYRRMRPLFMSAVQTARIFNGAPPEADLVAGWRANTLSFRRRCAVWLEGRCPLLFQTCPDIFLIKKG